MWMLSVNGNQSTNGKVRRISIDGTEVLDVAGMNNAHHDLTVLPGGIVATVLWSGESSSASDLVERSPDGTLKTVVRIADNVFGRRAAYHTNSISYRAADDTYVVGDLEAAGYAKLARDGKLLWEFGGACPTGAKCASGDAVGAHGHHLLDGRILFFKARLMPSLVYEYSLTETSSALSATRTWSYDPGDGLWTAALGDVQRLPNGNTLITWSLSGQMRELSPAGELIQTTQPYTLNGTRLQFGYADFRQTLYGPPPR